MHRSVHHMLSITPLSLILATGISGSVLAQPDASLANEVIVKFSSPHVSGYAEADRLSESLGRHFTYTTDTSDGRLIFRLNEHQSAKAMNGLSRAIERLSGVTYAEPNSLMQRFTEPDDPYFSSYQWHYYGPDTGEDGGLNAVNAWAAFLTTPATSPVTVAVLDTGQTQHPDLDANTIAGYDMISYTNVSNDGDGRDSDPSDPGDNTNPSDPYGSSWHGTHVAGTIGAVTNNATGVAGVGYDRVNLMHVRVLGVGGGYTSDIADGIRWAADNGASVINMSLGGAYTCDANSITQAAINYAVSKNATVVVSAGNSNDDAANYSPAGCQNVISVAAANRNGDKADYSNYGSVVDVAAPGGEGSNSVSTYIVSTHNDGVTSPGNPAYQGMYGTSMAAPHISGLAALLYSEDSSVTPAEVESVITETARPNPTCNGCGSGIADAVLALESLGSTDPEEPTVNPPAAPGYLLASAENNAVNLLWENVSGEDTYALEYSYKLRGKRWSNYIVIDDNIPADTTEAVHSPGDGTYKYRIRAANSAGASAWTDTASNISVESGDDGSGGGGSGKCHPKRGC